MEWLSIIISLVFAGVVAGLLAGLLGVGGGIVVVPVLYMIFTGLGIEPVTAMPIATGTSLLTIIATSFSSIKSHHGKGNIDQSLAKLWGPGLFIGAIFGGLLSAYVRGQWSSLVFCYYCSSGGY